MTDSYLTISRPSKIEIKRKGSRFIGEALLVETAEAAVRQLELIRKREHAATHHCYAWRVGRPGQEQFKYSDDGEPGGSAGRPIYDVVCGRNLTNLLLVVTRYFGGTKLGTGGLVRAYGDAASEALEEAGQVECFIMGKVRVRLAFSLYDQMVKLIHSRGARVTGSDFADRVTLAIEIRLSELDSLKRDIVELSSGKAEIEQIA